jgi:succinate dehydrogenase hydrophobic anchor subunit
MLRLPQTSRSLLLRSQRRAAAGQRKFSSPANPLEADAGALATRVHHAMTTSLAFLTPVYFLVPESWSDGAFNKTFGLLLTVNITAHSWIGLNYVATDYVPKLSKALLGPARIVNVAFAAITLIGMSKMCLSSPGGIKAVVKGVWNPKPKKAD